MDKNLELLIRLQQVPRLGITRILKILAQIELEQLDNYRAEQLKNIGWDAEQIKAWLQPQEKVLADCWQWLEMENNSIVTILDNNYPSLLNQIHEPPILLFVKGNLDLLNQPQIAMVGSRNCSAYGAHWATYFASSLAYLGLTITSGLALGIDSICHQAALNAQGKTIAVLGSGVENIYPAKHKKLAAEIIQNDGAVISEFMPDTPPLAPHFPRRNRIISGLTLGTLVIEAGIKSGSLITASYALEQNRDVFAVPHGIQDQFSQGCHKLIKQGAMLVEDINDILECLGYVAPNLDASISTKQADLVVAHPELLAKISYKPLSVDELCVMSNCPVEQLLIQLLDLELQGVIRNIAGSYVRC